MVLLTQADMFDPTVPNPAYADYSAFQPIVQAIAEESAAFDGPVYLFNGDSHVFNQRPARWPPGSPWLSFYGVRRPVDQPDPDHRRRLRPASTTTCGSASTSTATVLTGEGAVHLS